jgi:hypothetical protein
MKMETEMINNESSKSKLPLDWTYVTRKRAKQGSSSSRNGACVSTIGRDTNESSRDNLSQDEEEYACSCCSPIVIDEYDNTYSDMTWKEEGTTDEATSRREVMNQLGIGIFCLHDTDTSWFQGYFIPKSSGKHKPIGILAVQRDIDECVQCAFGGYRELDVTLYNFLTTKGGRDQDNTGNSSSITIPIVCTGGDMLRMRTITRGETPQDADGSVVNLSFDATTIYTGRKAIPYLKTYFASLVQKQRELLLVQTIPTDDSVQDITKMSELDLLPDCAIVCGDMVLRTT